MALFLGLVISGGLTCLAGAVGAPESSSIATWKMDEHGPLQGPLINDLPKRNYDFHSYVTLPEGL